jgi:peptidoglycan/LPS O-acetylase OafA/YrhL
MAPETAAAGRGTAGRDTAGQGNDGFRPDIQGLRALAVSMVVIYHLQPSLLPGGFAGVDVFFVISGFLITGHLLREYRKAGTVSLVGFWGRRARRLLPAAVVVLAATWVASLLILPSTQLSQTAAQVRASALYFQNWQLASDAVDYLKSTAAATPVQHFWSLSVEEQFYLAWPLLFLVAGVGVARRGAASGKPGKSGKVILACLAVALTLGSLGYSAWETRANPAAAYFVTSTRIWELGAGGLVALLPAGAARVLGRQGWLGWAGLATAVTSAFVLHASAAFPGVIALLPVGGTAAAIACGAARGKYGPARLTSLPPLVFLGGISYSLYLWHWPLIVLWTSYWGHRVNAITSPLLAADAVLLSWLTKMLIEDRVRQARLLAGHSWRSVSVALAAVVPVALVTGFLVAHPTWNGRLGPGYPGAAVLADTVLGDARNSTGTGPGSTGPGSTGSGRTGSGRTGPGPGAAAALPVLPPIDAPTPTLRPAYWQEGCLADRRATTPKPCVFGDTTHPRLTVALVGDSIAGNWFPALNAIAEDQHWKLVTELHGNCAWTSTMLFYGPTSGPYTQCHQWGAAVLHDLTTTIRPDVVITSGRAITEPVNHPRVDAQARAEVGAGMATYWGDLIRRGIAVIAIRETPELRLDPPTCLAKNTGDQVACGVPVALAIVADPPSSYAARALGGQVTVVNLDSLICGPQDCDPVVGNVLVYFDSHHLTSAYVQTMAPFVRQRLLAASPELRRDGAPSPS